MIYFLYKTNGSVETYNTKEKMALKEFQDLVGGNIEFAPEEADGSVPMVNEDGLGLMLPRNPFFKPAHQPYYVGDILHGKMIDTDEGMEFVGFDEEEAPKFLRKVIGYDASTFSKNQVFTVITIGDFMGQTTRTEIKATGEMYKGVAPIFKENKKGVRKMFTVKKLDDPETLLFKGTDLPFKIDSEIVREASNGFTNTSMLCNALINLVGDAEEIKKYIETKNLNPFFSSFDRINLCEGEKETLLFTDVPTDSRLVMGKREEQANRK